MEVQNYFLCFAVANPMRSRSVLQYLTFRSNSPLLTSHKVCIICWSYEITAELISILSSYLQANESKRSTHCCCLTLVLLVMVLMAVSATYLKYESGPCLRGLVKRAAIVLVTSRNQYLTPKEVRESPQTVRIAGIVSSFSRIDKSLASALCLRYEDDFDE